MSKKRKLQVRKDSRAKGSTLPAWARHLPWIITALCALWLVSKGFRSTGKLDGMDIARFGRLPVVEEGRVKPYDTLARNCLSIISEKQDFVEEVPGQFHPQQVKRPAIKWLLDVLSGAPAAANHKVFRIENLEVQKIIQLPRRQRYRYSLKEITPQISRIIKEAGSARQKQDDKKELSLTEKSFLKLGAKVQLYVNLTAYLTPLALPPHDGADWQTVAERFAKISHAQFGMDENAMKRRMQQGVASAIQSDPEEALRAEREGFLEILISLKQESFSPWAAMLLSYQNGDAADFDRSMDEYEKWLGKNPPPDTGKTGLEIVYNRLQPFSACAALYLIAFLLVCLAWLFEVPGDAEKMKTLGRMIFGVVCFGLLLSFLGTVLGGLWADDSWGRFWGWDPKENGALIIVLWNVLILHARLGGLVQARGLAVLVLGGNIVTAWSWFGVNQLGVGLHAYGAVSGITFWLLVFVTSQLVLIVLGCLPLKIWLLPDRPKSTRAPQWAALFNRAAFYLITLTLGVHTLALVARIYISGYPPVTTLYSSAIFIGWGAVILGLLLERFYPRQMGIGNTVAATAGYVTLLIAHNLAIGDGDTFTMMQAVLDTKFWLATHVTCVTLGYTATFVAGGLGIYTLLRSNRWCFPGLGLFFLFWAGGGVVAEKKWGITFPRSEIGDHLVDPKMIFLVAGLALLAIGCLSLYRADWGLAKSKGVST